MALEVKIMFAISSLKLIFKVRFLKNKQKIARKL